jgi:hypothetical protein
VTLVTTVTEPLYVNDALSCLEDLHSIEALDEMVHQLGSCSEARVSRALCRTLWRTAQTEYRDAVVRTLRDSDSSKVIAALDAITFSESGEAFELALQHLSHKVWQVRVAALGLLQRSIGYDNEERVVQAAIERVGQEEGRVRDDLVRFLSGRMNGANGGTDVERWQQLWSNYKHDRETGELDDPNRTVSTYYGIPIYSKHIVFVIDTSGSMAHPHGIQRKSKPKRPVAVTTETGKPGSPKQKQRRELDWDKITTKIDLAKAELIRTLEELDEDVSFSIVTYNHEFKVLSDKLVKATPKNKKRFIAMVQKLTANGATDAFFRATFAGMDCAVRDRKPRGGVGSKADLRVQYADTVFFLTDGFPTHGPGPDNIMPPEMIRANVAKLREHYELRKVAINTIGIGPHDMALLGEIAEMTGGTYVDLSH